LIDGNEKMIISVLVLFGGLSLIFGLNRLSYNLLKKKIFFSRKWDLNVCCGRTNGGGVNTDIVNHAGVPNLVLADPLSLPFKDDAFNRVMCSHAAEHIHDPDKLMVELNRVGCKITIIVPPIRDLAATFNFLEHKWIFLCVKKEFQNRLPKRIRLPMASLIQKYIGQFINA
jgi:SAM-dependent methyltransferase